MDDFDFDGISNQTLRGWPCIRPFAYFERQPGGLGWKARRLLQSAQRVPSIIRNSARSIEPHPDLDMKLGCYYTFLCDVECNEL